MSIITSNKPPALILGGQENALAVVRSLSKKGVSVSVSAFENARVLKSRFCKGKYVVPKDVTTTEYWSNLLLGDQQTNLKGSVIFACSDDAIQFLVENRDKLEDDYILDDFVPSIHKALLDKQETLRLAREVGISTPNYWNVESVKDIENVKEEIVFPVIIKPIHSHLFQREFDGKKFFRSEDYDELIVNAKKVIERGLEFMISELIPGPDSLLHSYNTYHDKDGVPIFQYTKNIERRFPLNHGGACYHSSEWLPEIVEVGSKFFNGIGFRGLGNVEFKYDTRDGQYKIIESNTRFTGGLPLIIKSGADIAYLVYCHLAGLPVPKIDASYSKMGYWYLIPDIKAYLELRKKGLITFPAWIKSLMRKQAFPYFKWDDPGPSIAEWKSVIGNQINKFRNV